MIAASDQTDMQQTLPAATSSSDQRTAVKNAPSRPHHIALTEKPPDPDDEAITLVQFLAECDRSPRSRVGEPVMFGFHFIHSSFVIMYSLADVRKNLAKLT